MVDNANGKVITASGTGCVAAHSTGDIHHHHYNSNQETFKDFLNRAHKPKGLGELQSYFHPRTREWVLDAIWNWAVPNQGNKIFAVVGDAGIGKSVLSAHLISLIAKDTKNGFWNSLISIFVKPARPAIEILAYHFFDFQTEYKAKDCIKSLCNQLLNRFGDEFGQHLDNTIDRKDIDSWPLKSCFEKLILEPLCDMEKRKSRSIIVIDALDECEVGKDFNKDVVKVWQDRMPSWVGLFVTCRPSVINFYETEREAARNGVTMIKTGDPKNSSEGHVEQNMNDIKLVLEDLLKNRLSDENVRQATIDVIARKSEGLFLYLRFFKKQLPDLSDEELSKPTSLPKGITAYYVEYFERLLKALGNDIDKYQRMLSVILASREPLPLPLWMQACGVSGDLNRKFQTDEEFINAKKECGTLMHIPQTLDSCHGVTFVHKSMPDFLTQNCNDPDLIIDVAKLQVPIDNHGIVQLIENVFTNPGEYSTANQYAARNLFYHYCKANEVDKATAMLFQLDTLLSWLKYATPMEVRNDITNELLPLLTNQDVLADAQVVVKVLRLGQHALTADGLPTETPGKQVPSQLPSQILGRLSEDDVENRGRLKQLRDDACKYDPGVPWMRPACTSLHSALPGGLLQTLFGHSNWVQSVSFNLDGSRIVSSSIDTTIRIWDTSTGQQVGEPLVGHSEIVSSVSFNHDGTRIVSGSNDKTIRIWDISTGQQVGEPLVGHSDIVTSVSFNYNGTRIVSGSWDKTIRIWDTSTGQQVGEPLLGHSDWVRSVSFNHDGTRIVSGSYDYTIRIWDTSTRQQVGEPLVGHSEIVSSVSFNHDGTRIVSSSRDKTIRIWDTSTGQQVGDPLIGHSDWVQSVSFNHDATRIVSGSRDKTIRVWDTSTGQQVGEPLLGHSTGVRSVSFNHDGTRIVSGSHDSTIRIWDTSTGQQVGEPLVGHSDTVTSVSFNHDGTRIVSSSRDKTIRIWDTSTGQQVGEPLLGHSDWVRSVSFNHDGTRIVSGSYDYTIRIWDTSTRQQVGEPLEGHYDWVRSVSFNHDGTRIVSGSHDDAIRIWDTSTGQQIGEPLVGHSQGVASVSFNHNGTRIVSGSPDKTILIWDTSTGQQVGEPLLGHSGAIYAVSFNHDGTRIVSGSYDNTIRIWDTSTGQQVGEPLLGHSSIVHFVSFNQDGTRIVSASADNTIRIWDTSTGQQVDEHLSEDTHTEQLSGFETVPIRSETSTVSIPGLNSVGFTLDHGTPLKVSCALKQQNDLWTVCLVDENHRIHFLTCNIVT